MAQATATRIPSLAEWEALRAWASRELAKREVDVARDVPLHARSREEATAALHAARVAYGPFLALF